MTMGFRDSKNKLGARVRCAFDRLKHSKSSIGLSKVINGEISMIRAVSPMPLPVLTLPAGISHRLAASTLFEGMMRESIMFLEPRSLNKSPEDEASNQSSAKVESEMHSSTAVEKVVEPEGPLEPPITLRPAPLNASLPELPLPALSPSSPLVHPGLLRSNKSGPFTPELIKNPTEDTPGGTTSITTPDADGYFPKTEPSDEELPSRASSPSSVYSQNSYTMTTIKGKENCTTPHSAAPRTVKMNVSPVRQFLRRRGPVPTTQPLSSKLLQSMMSSNSDKSLSVESECTSTESDTELSDYLKQLCPGGGSMDHCVLEDPEAEPPLLTKTTEPLRVVRRGLSRRSINASASAFTDVTGYISSSSLE